MCKAHSTIWLCGFSYSRDSLYCLHFLTYLRILKLLNHHHLFLLFIHHRLPDHSQFLLSSVVLGSAHVSEIDPQ